MLDTSMGTRSHEVSAGVPQGSVLGPLLWNTMYLGVFLDTRLCYREHLEYIHGKASETSRALSRILLNTRGPKQCKRKLLTSVVTSQLLYAAPIWAEAAKVKSYVRGAEDINRLCALRVACGFRTVSDEAARVAAGLVPLGELVQEARLQGAPENPKGRWTHRLIPDIMSWFSRKPGEVDFYLTQVLSGHGCFRSYLMRFGHDTEDHCPECGTGVEENAHHVLFECHRFHHERQALEEAVGTAITADSLVSSMRRNA
nr:uncharacterized protein LOC121503182 [Drosophila kikkawai]